VSPATGLRAGPGVRLEPLRWWQLEAVVAWEAQLFPATAWSLATFVAELARVPDTRTYLAALAGPALVGYAGLAALPPDADIQTVAVAPRWQGRGLGRALLDGLLADAAVRGCRRVHLEVAAGNVAAQALYARAGFEHLARRARYYDDGSDALVLRRVLPGPGQGR